MASGRVPESGPLRLRHLAGGLEDECSQDGLASWQGLRWWGGGGAPVLQPWHPFSPARLVLSPFQRSTLELLSSWHPAPCTPLMLKSGNHRKIHTSVGSPPKAAGPHYSLFSHQPTGT